MAYMKDKDIAAHFINKTAPEGSTRPTETGGGWNRSAGYVARQSYRGDVFYSYRTAVAKRIGDVLIVSKDGYSNTTRKHLNRLRRAALNANMRIISADPPNMAAATLYDVGREMKARVNEVLPKLRRVKSPGPVGARIADSAARVVGWVRRNADLAVVELDEAYREIGRVAELCGLSKDAVEQLV